MYRVTLSPDQEQIWDALRNCRHRRECNNVPQSTFPVLHHSQVQQGGVHVYLHRVVRVCARNVETGTADARRVERCEHTVHVVTVDGRVGAFPIAAFNWTLSWSKQCSSTAIFRNVFRWHIERRCLVEGGLRPFDPSLHLWSSAAIYCLKPWLTELMKCREESHSCALPPAHTVC